MRGQFAPSIYDRTMSEPRYYTAMLLGMERVGVGEPVTMRMPDSGEPPKELRRPVSEEPGADVLVYQRHGGPDGDIYAYILVGQFPA